jgi:hypothetical protein
MSGIQKKRCIGVDPTSNDGKISDLEDERWFDVSMLVVLSPPFWGD